MSLLNVYRTHRAGITIAVTLVLFALMSNLLLVEAQVAAPSVTCVVVSEGGGQATVEVTVDTGGDLIDSVRMEMVVDSALSNPDVTRGDDFDTETPGVFQDAGNGSTYLVRSFGRSELAGPISGVLPFATIVFDWTGDATTITFDTAGILTGEGSYQLLEGDLTVLNANTCSVGGGAEAVTVFDRIADSTVHTILEQAIIAAGLDGTLDDETATYTVFAPNDATLTANGLSAADLTSDILLRHVIIGAAEMSTDITNGETYNAAGGNTLTADTTTGVVIEGLVPDLLGEVTLADITADNGVVHSIDFASDAPPATETPAGEVGNFNCVVVSAGGGQAVVDLFVDTGGLQTDSVRMEMVVDSALSNPVVERGAEFNTETPGVFQDIGGGNAMLVRSYGRSDQLGPIVGDALVFARVTFDWTGVATDITFDQTGSLTGEGTYQLLLGDLSYLGVETCSIDVTATPEPTAVPATSTPEPAPGEVGNFNCVVVSADGGQAVVDLFVDTGGLQTDSVRMEMVVDSALSNPVVERGADFNTETPGVFQDIGGGNTMLVRSYGRSDQLGPTGGDALAFARVTFDWTGVATDITFDQTGSLTGEGTYQLILGDLSYLGVEICSIDVTATPEPTAMPTAVPDTPTPVPSAALGGTVTDSDGAPVPMVEVNLLNESGAVAQTQETGDDGSYTFNIESDDVNQNYTIEFVVASVEGTETSFMSGVVSTSELPTGDVAGVTDSILVEPGDADTADAVIDRSFLPGVVSGTVTELGGAKENIEVTLLDESGAVYETMTTDASGDYIFNIPADDVEQNYTLSYVIPGIDIGTEVIAAEFTEGIRDIVSVDDNATTTATSQLFELPSGGSFVNDVGYGAPTSVELSSIETLESDVLVVMMSVVVLATSAIFVKTRHTYFSQ